MSECFMGTGFRFGRMNKFWRWMEVMVAEQRECASRPRAVHLDMAKIVNFTLRVLYQNKKTIFSKERENLFEVINK